MLRGLAVSPSEPRVPHCEERPGAAGAAHSRRDQKCGAGLRSTLRKSFWRVLAMMGLVRACARRFRGNSGWCCSSSQLCEADPHGSEFWEGDSCFPGAVFQQGRTDHAGSTGAGCRIYSGPLHVVTQRQIPMAQKIGKAMKFFWMQFIDRPSMCFSCRPCSFLRKNSSMSGNERSVVHCVCCRRKERSR